MARVDRLTALRAQREKRPGMHADGRGLYLRINHAGARSWILRYMLDGRRHDMGLGSADDVSLADARRKAREARSLKAEGVDPLGAKRAHRAAAREAGAKAVTFKDAATSYIAAHRSGWRSVKHATQWQQSLADYMLPVIGPLPVAAIDTALVLKVLEPIWGTKTETASRVRSRIEATLDWAKVRGYRDGENPARWRGHLDKLLPKPSKVNREDHHPALPYAEMPRFMAELRSREDAGARALEFLILVAARSGEVRLAKAAEFDRASAVWTVPASHMKTNREHRIPLSPAALALVNDAIAYTAKNTMRKLLAKMRPAVTVHGFRSTFRDWCGECTAFPREIAEAALAHVTGNAVERAYARSDLLDKRRELMNAWGTYCCRGV
jgi:integrase